MPCFRGKSAFDYSKVTFPKSLAFAVSFYFPNSFSETVDKFGDIPIPLELSALGLPIAPPFNKPLNDEPLNISKLLAKIHRSPFTDFLFDVVVAADVKEASKTRLLFNYTPSINHLMLVASIITIFIYFFIYLFSLDSQSRYFDNQTSYPCLEAGPKLHSQLVFNNFFFLQIHDRTNELASLKMFQTHSHSSASELPTQKQRNRKMLTQIMTLAVKYMNEFTHAPKSKKTNELVQKRIKETVNFLMKLEEVIE